MADNAVAVIAHRGASGYLPEHTLEAKAYAHALGADYLEQDIVATRDDQLIVLHDIHLDRVTDVAVCFPGRHRDDGRYYARDFDLDEIRRLTVCERLDETGAKPVFPDRFPSGTGRFRVPTLREEIRFIQGLNRSTGRIAGLYPEIKRPAWHRAEGVDLSPLVLELLHEFGYRDKSDAVFLQCFDADEVHRIRHDLGCRLSIVQLIAENSWGESATDYDRLRTAGGLRDVAESADGIGPWIGQLVSVDRIDAEPVSSGLVAAAHAAGLVVHPYTFRTEQVAPGFENLQAMIAWFVEALAIDGLFTDFPDIALAALGRRAFQ